MKRGKWARDGVRSLLGLADGIYERVRGTGERSLDWQERYDGVENLRERNWSTTCAGR